MITSTNPVIHGITIRRDDEGRYCLNDLHKAAGGNQKHRPKYWLENQLTKDLIMEIGIGGIPPIHTKQGLGTHVTKELVYAYAMWISPKFHLKVIRAYDAMQISAKAVIPDFSNPAKAARAWAEQYEAAQHAIATKAEIGSRREASAMNTASQAVKRANRLEIELDKSKKYSTIKRMEMLHHGVRFNWRLLKSTSIEMGIESIDVFDPNFGTVKAYHSDVWFEAYALDINQ